MLDAYKRFAAGLVLLMVAGSASVAAAQTQPYFLIIVDTSGSMTGATSGGTNSCGQAANRMSDARCVIQNVVNGYGEINFGLERFANSCSGSCSASCTATCGCSCTRTCNATAASGEMLVPIVPGNQADILRWTDSTCGTCTTTIASNPELSAGGNTPLAGSLRASRLYFQGSDPTFGTSPIATDPFSACRPYAVILLTDGGETCTGDPPMAATELRTTMVGGTAYDINTYVIGFGISPGSANIENIAIAGGTDAPGANRGFYATDETSLSLAFSQIISDSILFETCNGLDDDCDTLIDEGFTLYCDRTGGIPPPPSLCVDPGETVCDGVDDNCDGMIDEGLLNACGVCGPAPVEVCDVVDNDCDGIIDEGVCGGCIPTAEICDNLDNDCDMAIDEMLTRPCGTDTGVCTAGLETCAMGVWGTCSGTGPMTEICDNLDNDCNGVIDGMSRPCGSSVGRCLPGTEVCTMGMFGACVGGVGPIPETCNGIDDDCDGMTDEGNPEGGVPCGDGTGECVPGTTLCVMGMLTCDGAVGPTMEICDGLDNDCDGVVDDGIPVGAPCGSDVGECMPGRFVCRMGALVCEGSIDPIAELCDLLDNDCDGPIDEGMGLGMACGTDEGECTAGALMCVDGRDVCVGEVPPSRETCDCEDDDCDGTTDEEPSMGSLCPAGSTCIDCSCALPCVMSEFGFSCPTGREPSVQPDGSCFCVADACDDVACAMETQERDGTPVCGPAADLPDCICRSNACTDPCDGVVCMGGLVCDTTGACVEDSCRGLGCPMGEVCNAVTGDCEIDPCEGVSCAMGEACRDGTCEGSCAAVDCPMGERCAGGVCVDHPCDGVVCDMGEVCDPTDSRCTMDLCDGVSCPLRTVCDPLTGECNTDPCLALNCPDGESCVDGECTGMEPEVDAGPMGVDAGGIDASTTEDTAERLLASGGCGECAVGRSNERLPRGGMALLLGLLGLAAWRRRKRS